MMVLKDTDPENSERNAGFGMIFVTMKLVILSPPATLTPASTVSAPPTSSNTSSMYHSVHSSKPASASAMVCEPSR